LGTGIPFCRYSRLSYLLVYAGLERGPFMIFHAISPQDAPLFPLLYSYPVC
jgi:hypothetical protein